ncbi:MAG: hypothetical protein AB7U45_13795 [Desulfamplus sp.]
MQKEQGITLKEIALNLGVEEGTVKQYSAILNNVVTENLELAKQHQEGRVGKDSTIVGIFNFTEGWFRNSGIYDLKEYENEFIPPLP